MSTFLTRVELFGYRCFNEGVPLPLMGAGGSVCICYGAAVVDRDCGKINHRRSGLLKSEVLAHQKLPQVVVCDKCCVYSFVKTIIVHDGPDRTRPLNNL